MTVMTETWATCAVLGAGGINPRVDVVDPNHLSVSELRAFGPESSAYALSRSPDGNRLLVGTKSGLVFCLSPSGQDQGDAEEGRDEKTLPHKHAPVLAVAFVSNDAAVVANAGGGCWFYTITGLQTSSHLLESSGRTVCALCPVGNGVLAGLTRDGYLILWDTHRFAIIDELEAPVPSPRAGLVRLLPWGAPHSFVYPTATGEVATFNTETRFVGSAPAHSGEWYAMAHAGDDLLTIGMEDGVVRVWTPELKPTTYTAQGPVGVVSAGWLDREAGTVLLVTIDGQAGVYTMAGGKFRHLHTLPGADYRVCDFPDSRVLKESQDRKALTRARNTSQQVLERFDEGADATAGLLHLESQGFPHVALTLRAEAAERAGNLAGALQAYSALASILPDRAHEGHRALSQYAALLEEAWMFDEATDVYRRIQGTLLGLDRGKAVATENLSVAMSEEFTVCDSDHDIATLCACATAVGKGRSGRWLTKEMCPLVCDGVALGVGAFVDKYNAIRRDERQDLPEAAFAEVAHVSSRRAILRGPSVVFLDGDRPRFDLCLRFGSSESGLVITPLVLFSIPPCPPNVPVQDHNREIVETYSAAKQHTSVRSRLRATFDGSIYALRRLVTLAKATHRAQGGNTP